MFNGLLYGKYRNPANTTDYDTKFHATSTQLPRHKNVLKDSDIFEGSWSFGQKLAIRSVSRFLFAEQDLLLSVCLNDSRAKKAWDKSYALTLINPESVHRSS